MTPPKRRYIAPLQGTQGETIDPAILNPVSIMIAEEMLRNLVPGQLMPDGTIYLCKYSPRDRERNSLGKTFNVFAAANDLPGIRTYKKTWEYLAKRKNLHGYAGTNYPTDKEFYAAIEDGSYDGGWIIPTSDILYGKDLHSNETVSDNLLAHRDTGAFSGQYKIGKNDGFVRSSCYWSSTGNRDAWFDFSIYGVNFLDGSENWYLKHDYRLRCRPVRLVECKTGSGALHSTP